MLENREFERVFLCVSKKAGLSEYGNVAVLDALTRVLHSVVVQRRLLVALASLVIAAALAFSCAYLGCLGNFNSFTQNLEGMRTVG